MFCQPIHGTAEWILFALHRSSRCVVESAFGCIQCMCTLYSVQRCADVWVPWRNEHERIQLHGEEEIRMEEKKRSILIRHLALIFYSQQGTTRFYQMRFPEKTGKKGKRHLCNSFTPMRPHLRKWAWQFFLRLFFALLEYTIYKLVPGFCASLKGVGRFNLVHAHRTTSIQFSIFKRLPNDEREEECSSLSFHSNLYFRFKWINSMKLFNTVSTKHDYLFANFLVAK